MKGKRLVKGSYIHSAWPETVRAAYVHIPVLVTYVAAIKVKSPNYTKIYEELLFFMRTAASAHFSVRPSVSLL